MTKDEIIKSARVLCTAYNRALTDELIALMLSDYAEWSSEDFNAAVRAHRIHPERGKFYPTLADLRQQLLGTREQARADAGMAFDQNPTIDGTLQYDADRETYDQRERRRRAYVSAAASDFESLSRVETPALAGGAPAGITHLPARLRVVHDGDEPDEETGEQRVARFKAWEAEQDRAAGVSHD